MWVKFDEFFGWPWPATGHNRGTMLLDRKREKLINAIIYFARNTRYLGKIKLFKLLYLLDFEHFRQTGQSVTGLEYRAWQFGPVPISLMAEWEGLQSDMAEAIAIRPERVFDYYRDQVYAQAEFDDRHFTKRELRIMAELADKYRDVMSPEMIDLTHVENGAWAKIWRNGQGFDHPIPYHMALAVDEPNRDAILEAARDYEAMVEAMKG